MPIITVIVPVYKVEPYLHRCVESILNQTFTDFELILVDDGSPDNCGIICDEYLKNAKISVVHQMNRGLSVARNIGIEWSITCSDSKWIGFVDSDDWIHPRFFEFLFEAVNKGHTRISACPYEKVIDVAPMNTVSLKYEIISWDNFIMQKTVQAIVAWNKLYEKDLFNGLRYPIGKIHEDEFLTYKILDKARDVSYVYQPLYYYYQNESGITKKSFYVQRLDVIDALYERIQYFERKKAKKEFLVWCVRHFFRCSWKLNKQINEMNLISDEVLYRQKEMRKKYRIMLIKYGFKYIPPWCDAQYYDYAFPRITRFARKGMKVLKN